MAQRISTSQLRSKLRQAQQKHKQDINKINQNVRLYNQNVRQTITKYNQAVRSHNARIRANRSRLKSELTRLSYQTTSTKYVVYSTSVHTLHQTYNRMENQAETQHWDSSYNRMLDLSEREVANSIEVTNYLLGTEPKTEEHHDELQDATLVNQLREISEDLDDRWKGAVFSLSPQNPDASRHFCTSTREIINRILEIKAPDTEVLRQVPDCTKTEHGKPTRRSKIKYLLQRKGMTEETLEEFIEQDMGNIIQLVHILSSGTHGLAGKFDLNQLSSLKKRVEDGIFFLFEIV